MFSFLKRRDLYGRSLFCLLERLQWIIRGRCHRWLWNNECEGAYQGLVKFKFKMPFVQCEAASFGLVRLLAYALASSSTSKIVYAEFEVNDVFLAPMHILPVLDLSLAQLVFHLWLRRDLWFIIMMDTGRNGILLTANDFGKESV